MSVPYDDAPGAHRLPNPREFLTSLVSSLPLARDSFSDPTSTIKERLLTLHVLFPSELLPALDLLDRGLVTRLVLSGHDGQEQQRREPSNDAAGTGSPSLLQQPATAMDVHRQQDARAPAIYYVRSGQEQPSNSRYRDATSGRTTRHEVRLDSWSCSCPAFAFAALPVNNLLQIDSEQDPSIQGQSKHGWTFGGLRRGADTPVCKHLLACVLLERGGLPSHVEERQVSMQEWAGWAAGWGD